MGYETGSDYSVKAHLLGMLLSPLRSTSIHSTPAFTQLLQAGNAPSHRIFRVLHLWHAVTTFFFGVEPACPCCPEEPPPLCNEDVEADLERLICEEDGRPGDNWPCTLPPICCIGGGCCGGHPVVTPGGGKWSPAEPMSTSAPSGC